MAAHPTLTRLNTTPVNIYPSGDALIPPEVELYTVGYPLSSSSNVKHLLVLTNGPGKLAIVSFLKDTFTRMQVHGKLQSREDETSVVPFPAYPSGWNTFYKVDVVTFVPGTLTYQVDEIVPRLQFHPASGYLVVTSATPVPGIVVDVTTDSKGGKETTVFTLKGYYNSQKGEEVGPVPRSVCDKCTNYQSTHFRMEIPPSLREVEDLPLPPRQPSTPYEGQVFEPRSRGSPKNTFLEMGGCKVVLGSGSYYNDEVAGVTIYCRPVYIDGVFKKTVFAYRQRGNKTDGHVLFHFDHANMVIRLFGDDAALKASKPYFMKIMSTRTQYRHMSCCAVTSEALAKYE